VPIASFYLSVYGLFHILIAGSDMLAILIFTGIWYERTPNYYHKALLQNSIRHFVSFKKLDSN